MIDLDSPPILAWNPQAVAAAMLRNGIQNRRQLADALPDISRAVIYRSLNQNWEGKATASLLASISDRFSTPLESLVRVTQKS